MSINLINEASVSGGATDRVLRMPYKAVIALLLGFILSAVGCSSHVTTITNHSVWDATSLYYVKDVYVSVSDDFEVDTGLFDRADNLTDEEFFRQVTEVTERVIKEELPPVFKGERPSNIIVEFYRIDISSGMGRALGGTNSILSGWVRVEDAVSGKVIAEDQIQSADYARRGNLGVLLNMAEAAFTDEVEEIVHKFTKAMRIWLLSGQPRQQRPIPSLVF